jgi:phage shock protein A
MTSRVTTKPPTRNGAEAQADEATKAEPTTEERLAALEQQVARMGAAVASLLAEKMQPQIQQIILERLKGVSQPTG